jgi:hypothetical protein
MKSRGDSCGLAVDVGRYGVGTSVSVAGGEGSCKISFASLEIGESLLALARKLGIGNAEGAGEAWKVAPAKAAAEPDFEEAERCGGGGV